jgi:phospholipid transport system substrate-binding protein
MKALALLTLLATLFLPPAALAAVEDSAQQLVRTTMDRVLAVVRDRGEQLKDEPGELYRLVDKIILPHFDFQRMSRDVLRRYWDEASPEQRERFIEEFKNLLVRTYAKALTEYSDQKVKFLPLEDADGDDRVTVRTEVYQEGGFPIPISYSMYKRESRWLVYDVTIDGVSLVKNYRSAYRAQIRRGGLEQLIGMLAERNQSVRD